MARRDTGAADVPPHTDVIVVLDFGSQYAQLIARRVREAGVFSLLAAPDTPLEKLREYEPKGIILSGGPASVTDRDVRAGYRRHVGQR